MKMGVISMYLISFLSQGIISMLLIIFIIATAMGIYYQITKVTKPSDNSFKFRVQKVEEQINYKQIEVKVIDDKMIQNEEILVVEQKALDTSVNEASVIIEVLPQVEIENLAQVVDERVERLPVEKSNLDIKEKVKNTKPSSRRTKKNTSRRKSIDQLS
jgi:hypothetical protein